MLLFQLLWANNKRLYCKLILCIAELALPLPAVLPPRNVFCNSKKSRARCKRQKPSQPRPLHRLQPRTSRINHRASHQATARHYLGQLPLPQGRGARVPPAPDLTERINKHAQQLHVHGTRHGARVSAVDIRVLFGAKQFGGCGALCAEIDGAVAT